MGGRPDITFAENLLLNLVSIISNNKSIHQNLLQNCLLVRRSNKILWNIPNWKCHSRSSRKWSCSTLSRFRVWSFLLKDGEEFQQSIAMATIRMAVVMMMTPDLACLRNTVKMTMSSIIMMMTGMHSCKRRKNEHQPISPPKKLAPKNTQKYTK